MPPKKMISIETNGDPDNEGECKWCTPRKTVQKQVEQSKSEDEEGEARVPSTGHAA